MSRKDSRKSEEAEREPVDPARAHGQPERAADAPPAKSTYEFKILPADPKNAFDFEDVADK